MQLTRTVLEVDNEKLVCEALIKKDNVVILHGAGASNRKRYYSLAEAILRRGKGVILFDFSGHGESSGELKDSSLSRRKAQAQKVIEAFIPREGELYLIGFSMSGQTVCDLLPFYKGRVPAILLGCPGVYSRAIQEKTFGGGQFTPGIRERDSWKKSNAFNELRSFPGRTIIAIGKEDQIIPKEVMAALKKSSKHLTYFEFPNVDHQLAVWLAAHEDEQNKLLDSLLIARIVL